MFKADNKFKNALIPIVMLSFAIAIRQMSMTIVAPFISTYCKTLTGYTPLMAGLALGIFGLTQAIFQIPFGILSDKYGNKKMVLIGLTEVVIGLVIAYFSKNIMLLIFARALQGSGAIIGVAYSWVSGMVDKEKRTTALSILGAFISVAAALAFAIGPVLRRIMPVNHMFLACAILLFCNTIYILFFIKDTENKEVKKVHEEGNIKAILRDKTFIIMNILAFINNFMMVSVFYGVPIYLDKVTGQDGMWKVFVPSIIVAILMMKMAVKFADRGYNREVLIVSFLVSSLSLFFYFAKTSYIFLTIGTALFLSGYVTLGTIIATNVNNITKDSCRGTANGIFNSFQYIGNFIGAIVTAAVWSISDRLAWEVVVCFGIVGIILIVYNRKSQNVVQKAEELL